MKISNTLFELDQHFIIDTLLTSASTALEPHSAARHHGVIFVSSSRLEDSLLRVPHELPTNLHFISRIGESRTTQFAPFLCRRCTSATSAYRRTSSSLATPGYFFTFDAPSRS